MRRSLRIDDRLYSISYDAVQVHPLANPATKIAEVHLQDAGIAATGTSITAAAGIPFTGVVASVTITDPNYVPWPPIAIAAVSAVPGVLPPIIDPGPAAATIDWGDGHTSFGWVAPDGHGGYNILGTNTYNHTGAFTVTVTLIEYRTQLATVVTSPATVVDADVRFVDRLYHDLLRRAAEAAGLRFWMGRLQHGVSRADVVQAVEGSAEYHHREVADLYLALLGRPGDVGGLDYFTGYLASGGTVDGVKITMLGSAEFSGRMGASDADFLAAVYQRVLDRGVDPGGEAMWGGLLGQGTPRATVVARILQSAEARHRLAAAFYDQLLHRPGDSGGIEWLVGALQQGQPPEQLTAAVAASDEYFRQV